MRIIYPISTFFFIAIGIHALSGQVVRQINYEKWNRLVEFCDSTKADGIMALLDGKVAGLWRKDDCDSTRFNTASMVKSWTGLVVGILADQGLIRSEEDLVCDYLPEWEEGCINHVRIKHLLTMSGGINKRRGAEGILAAQDMHAYALQIKTDTLPGLRFSYSNESVQLLGTLIEKVTGEKANAYFSEVLFRPLGMDSTCLGKDPAGNDVVYGGAMTTLQDAAQVGMLMLNAGKHDGEQIVSESWIEKSVSPSENAPYYGYLWWLDNMSEHRNYAATGDGGKLTIVFPDLNLVFLRQQSCNLGEASNMGWMGPMFLEMISGLVVQ